MEIQRLATGTSHMPTYCSVRRGRWQYSIRARSSDAGTNCIRLPHQDPQATGASPEAKHEDARDVVGAYLTMLGDRPLEFHKAPFGHGTFMPQTRIISLVMHVNYRSKCAWRPCRRMSRALFSNISRHSKVSCLDAAAVDESLIRARLRIALSMIELLLSKLTGAHRSYLQPLR